MTLCYLGLGSNLRCPERQLKQALEKIRTIPQSVIIKRSSIYYSPPWGVKSQPPYCNMVIALQTTLPSLKLLSYCQEIENAQERIRKKRWGARTLDIDLLLFGKQKINHQRLIIPHPQMLKRDFVMIPLLEIYSNSIEKMLLLTQ